MKTFFFIMEMLFLPLRPVLWVVCRLTAKPCPACGERYFTSLQGEWVGEEWKCARCGHYWEVPFPWSKSSGK